MDAPVPGIGEGQPVPVGDGGMKPLRMVGQQNGHRPYQRQADDAAYRRRVWQRQPEPEEGGVHRRDDRVLAVNQGPITVK